ncbi:THAP domain-containing protein 5-like isoform X1 [Seriola aureovittata]|uniref:THAP domain-containing protein 5-like isoform X1 n=2 Tax=Seriola aureovittata TaxID=2871759 RepID=UPI0024BDFD32|nr:THAP domain-containing protein 5-like isoform X1 [Seriola aureovittata]
MPRYCAVKACRNRGGSASRQDNKRISFYPFPLQDKPRLQKWVDNMKREEWTPSRHQCLCSEHFTEDCFDIRWGIRYLKNTAIPTIFPSNEDDGEKKGTIIKRSPKAKPRTLEIDIEPTGFDCPLGKRPLILSRTCEKFHSSTSNNTVAEHTEMVFELPLVSDTGISCHGNQSDIQSAACEVPGDSGIPTASCLALSPCTEPYSEELADSTVTVMCCESLGPFSDGEAIVDAAALQAALGQAIHLVPVEMVKDEPTGCFLGEGVPSEGEHISVYEHSYCRPDTDKDQLWSKILSLHSKILELDHREESTVAKIHALETEIALLKRDGAVFKEKQKVLEDYISSMLL